MIASLHEAEAVSSFSLQSLLRRPLQPFLAFFASLPPMLQPTLRHAFANRYLLNFVHDNGEINHVYLYQ
jgi:hypothetical protein